MSTLATATTTRHPALAGPRCCRSSSFHVTGPLLTAARVSQLASCPVSLKHWKLPLQYINGLLQLERETGASLHVCIWITRKASTASSCDGQAHWRFLAPPLMALLLQLITCRGASDLSVSCRFLPEPLLCSTTTQCDSAENLDLGLLACQVHTPGA